MVVLRCRPTTQTSGVVSVTLQNSYSGCYGLSLNLSHPYCRKPYAMPKTTTKHIHHAQDHKTSESPFYARTWPCLGWNCVIIPSLPERSCPFTSLLTKNNCCTTTTATTIFLPFFTNEEVLNTFFDFLRYPLFNWPASNSNSVTTLWPKRYLSFFDLHPLERGRKVWIPSPKSMVGCFWFIGFYMPIHAIRTTFCIY